MRQVGVWGELGQRRQLEKKWVNGYVCDEYMDSRCHSGQVCVLVLVMTPTTVTDVHHLYV